MELIPALLVFIFWLAIFAAIGHGIWVVCEKFLRYLLGMAKKHEDSETPAKRSPTPQSDLAQATESLDRLYRGGVIDPDTYRLSLTGIRKAAKERNVLLPKFTESATRKLSSEDAVTVDSPTTEARHVAINEQPNATVGADQPRRVDQLPELQPTIQDEAPSPILITKQQSLPPKLEVHALDRSYEPEPPKPAQIYKAKSQRALGEVLQQFLSEKNIHWGELLSGLLIVGSAIGLILSLRSELNRLIPMFPSLLFFLVTIAIHLAGLYTLKQWKLPSTSRGLLVLGSIMMPVTAMASSLLSKSSDADSFTSISFLVPLIVGAIGFCILAFMSGRSLYQHQVLSWVAALVIGGIVPLFVDRLAQNGATYDNLFWASLLGMTSLGVVAGSLLPMPFLRRSASSSSITLPSQLRLMGISAVAVVISFGLMLFRIRTSSVELDAFSIPASIGGTLLMCVGGYLRSQVASIRTDDNQLTKSFLGTVTVVGSATLFVGASLFLIAMGFGWSHADSFLTIALLNMSLAIVMALLWNLPAMTAIASIFGAVGVWLVVQKWSGRFPTDAMTVNWIVAELPTMRSALTALGLSSASLMLAAFVLRIKPRKSFDAQPDLELGRLDEARGFSGLQRTSHAFVLFAMCCMHAAICFVIAGYLGIVSTAESDLIFAIATMATVSLGAIGLGRYLNRVAACLAGSVLLFGTCCILARTDTELSHKLGIAQWSLRDAVVLVGILHSTIVLVVCFGLRYLKPKCNELLASPTLRVLGNSSLVTSLLSAALLLDYTVQARTNLDIASYWLSHAVWLSLSAFTCWGLWLLRRMDFQRLLQSLSFSIPPVGDDVQHANESGLIQPIESRSPRPLDSNQLTSMLKELRPELLFVQWFAYLATFVTLCFAGAFVLMKLSATNALPETRFNLMASLCVVTATVLGTLFKRWKSAVMEVWGTRFGDGLTLAVAVYQQLHTWSHTFVWGRAVANGNYADAIVWSVSFVVVFASFFALTLLRHRSLYSWFTGLLSVGMTFLLVVTWSPSGGDIQAFLYMLAMAPVLVALVLAVADLVRIARRQQKAIDSLDAGNYEFLTGGLTIILWGLATLIGLTQALQGSQVAVGLWSPVGVAWAVSGTALLGLRAAIEPSRRFLVLLQLASFILMMNLPIVMGRTMKMQFETETFFALLLVAASLHCLVLVWFSVQVARWSRALWGHLQVPVSRSQLSSMNLIRNHVVVVASLILAIGLLLVCGASESYSIRLIALSAAMVGFANLAMDKLMPSGLSWAVPIRNITMLSAALFVIYLVWSGVDQSDWPAIWCSRILRLSSVLLLLCIGIAGLYAWMTAKLTDDHDDEYREASRNIAIHLSRWLSFTQLNNQSTWRDTFTRQWIALSLLTCVSLLVGILWMLAISSPGSSSVAHSIGRSVFGSETLIMILLAVVWIVQLVVQAVRKNWNVGQMYSETRSAYVYMAESVFCLMLIQLYMVYPELFILPLRQYWPIIMLVVAVTGQAISHVLQRSGVTTISRPLRNSSILIPILAAFGMFAFATDVSPDIVLALGSLFYFFMGATERSRAFAFLSGAFANVALLLFWRHFEDLSFRNHPQLWLIPPAASIALATHFERKNIQPETATWIRYFAMATIFCSSASEILLQGIGSSLWPPMVLMLLSVLTVFLGISFQVRSYLYSGMLFTLFALVAMVAHAQRSLQHTWPWWALGISLGIGILVLFGLFEKKRVEFNRLAERLKRWES